MGLESVCYIFGGTVLQALSRSWSVERRVQVRVRVRADGDQGVLSDRQVVVSGEHGAKSTLGKAAGQDPQGTGQRYAEQRQLRGRERTKPSSRNPDQWVLVWLCFFQCESQNFKRALRNAL